MRMGRPCSAFYTSFDMTPAVIDTNILIRHDERIATLEKRQDEDRADVGSLKRLIIGSLLTACGGLLVQVFALITRK